MELNSDRTLKKRAGSKTLLMMGKILNIMEIVRTHQQGSEEKVSHRTRVHVHSIPPPIPRSKAFVEIFLASIEMWVGKILATSSRAPSSSRAAAGFFQKEENPLPE